MKYWHYTTKEKLELILKDGYIKQADAFIEEGEKPVVWFSANQLWEHTANKMVYQNGQLITLTRKQMIDLVGIARIGINAETAPYDWEGFKKHGNTRSAILKGLVKRAKELRVSPKDWRVSFERVTADKWLAVQIWNAETERWEDSNWSPSFIPHFAQKSSPSILPVVSCRLLAPAVSF